MSSQVITRLGQSSSNDTASAICLYSLRSNEKTNDMQWSATLRCSTERQQQTKNMQQNARCLQHAVLDSVPLCGYTQLTNSSHSVHLYRTKTTHSKWLAVLFINPHSTHLASYPSENGSKDILHLGNVYFYLFSMLCLLWLLKHFVTKYHCQKAVSQK